MKVRRVPVAADKVEQNMTAMIDIVFQLLAFFVMTFKLASIEGNFDVKMPKAAPGSVKPLIPPIKVRLQADASGELSRISMGDRPLQGATTRDNFLLLNEEVKRFVGTGNTGPGMSEEEQVEVEIDADYNLKYTYVIDTITAVSGYLDGDKRVNLVEKIKFAQMRPSPD